jgi:beta-lactamase class A
VAHKTGTDATRNGLTRATNDVGIVTLPDGRHLAVAVFVKDSTADETTRDRAIAGVARAAYDAWVTK